MPLTIKVKNHDAQAPSSNTPSQTPAQEVASTPTGGIPKISFKKKDTGTPVTEQSDKKKPGRKPKVKDEADGETPVKGKPGRKRKADGDAANGDDTPSAKKPRPGGVRLQLNTTQPAKPPPSALGSAGNFHKIKLKQSRPEPPAQVLSKVRIKHVGHIPDRPVGVGYDSEDEDAEEDPAIEHQVILRFPPGNADCEYLTRMIEQRKIGVKVSEGGADVSFTFLSQDARRSMWTIRGNKYAGALFDLPTVTEVFKTWNKKDIMKSADISQILLILGPVQNEQQAREYPLPKEVDAENWEYPHGLTPPLKWVRKRRFRKRTNFRDIDDIEAQVKALTDADEACIKAGGTVDFEWGYKKAEEQLPVAQPSVEIDDGYGEEEDVDAEGEEEYEYEDEADVDAAEDATMNDLADEAEFLAAFEANLPGEGDDTINAAPTIEPAALHALAQQGGSSAADTPTGSSAPTPSAGEASANDDDYADEDDEGDEDEDEDMDEDEKARLEERAQQQEEFASLKQSLEEAKAAVRNTNNALLKARNQKRVDQLQNEVDLKKAALGIDDDDEE